MRVLVMGGTQFNGLALVHELVTTGHDVVILNRCLQFFPEPATALKRAQERVAPDGLLIVTGLAGTCPLYSVFGLNTCPRDGSC